MPHCRDCGGYVTQDFIRVFGIDGSVSGCPNCTTYRELNNGGAADETSESRSQEVQAERPR